MPTITRAKLFTSVILATFALTAKADWKVDFSRRMTETRTQDLRGPASDGAPEVDNSFVASPNANMSDSANANAEPAKPGFFQQLFDSSQVAGEIVVLNTEKGFIPSTIRVKKGQAYEIHVVNVNEKEKNVSFVLDAFSEHHATFYGQIKSFIIHPQKEGVYKFISPETSAQGKLVVYPGALNERMPASVSSGD